MQRSITNKSYLAPFAYVILFITYESLSSIYLFLPPLFAVLFVLFIDALKKEDSFSVFLISFCLVVYESQMGFAIFSSILYFSMIYKFVMPSLKKNFGCRSCIKLASVVLSYFGFYLFLVILSNIFLLPMPSINYYMLYYIIIEFLL